VHRDWWQGCLVNKQGKDVPFDWIKVRDDAPKGPPTRSGKRRKTDRSEEEETAATSCQEEDFLEEGAIVECWWDVDKQLDDWYYERWYGTDFKETGHGTPPQFPRANAIAWNEGPNSLRRVFRSGRGGWSVLRRRNDKETPNVDWVGKSVWESISQNITLADITAAVQP
jgi:hypothetical protein